MQRYISESLNVCITGDRFPIRANKKAIRVSNHGHIHGNYPNVYLKTIANPFVKIQL